MQIYSGLQIKQFELRVVLGWPEAERMQPQSVLLDLYIRFPNEPLACHTDQLDDHFCYDLLTQKMQTFLNNRSFRLIEFLAREIYQVIKRDLPNNAFVTIAISKHPPISAMKKGVQFWYGDENIT